MGNWIWETGYRAKKKKRETRDTMQTDTRGFLLCDDGRMMFGVQESERERIRQANSIGETRLWSVGERNPKKKEGGTKKSEAQETGLSLHKRRVGQAGHIARAELVWNTFPIHWNSLQCSPMLSQRLFGKGWKTEERTMHWMNEQKQVCMDHGPRAHVVPF